MASDNIDVYQPVIILAVISAAMVVIAIFVSRFLRPNKPTQLKETPYECGELPEGSAWSQFNIRFYVVGLIFIIFDVESALMFPVVAVFRRLNELGFGGLVLIEIAIFLAVLVAGIAYCWKKGDFDWVKSYQVAQVDDEL